jgi:hypothetical protein
MPRIGIRNKASMAQAEVKFNIEIRPSTPAQTEAGKRLFAKLLARARTLNQGENRSKQIGAEG